MSQQINLFNPVFLKKKKVFSAVAMLQALGLVTAGALLLAGYSGFQASTLRKQEAELSRQLAAAQAQLLRVKVEYGPREKSKALEDDIRKSEDEVRALKQILDILKRPDFGSTEGYSGFMRAFARQSLEGLWLTGFDIVGNGGELGIRGRALQPELVPQYIERLKQEPALRGKSFSNLEMHGRQLDLPAAKDAQTKQKKQVAFVEFNLQTSGVANQQAAASAGKK